MKYQEEHLRPCDAPYPIFYTWECVLVLNLFLGFGIFYQMTLDEKKKIEKEQIQRINRK
jgi:hypothetical protein